MKAGGVRILEHFDEVLVNEVGQHEAIVQLGPPPHRGSLVGLVPEAAYQGANEQLLGQAHPSVGRHLERAKLEQSLPAGGAVRAVKLVDAELRTMRVARHVDEQVAKHPVNQPVRHLARRLRVSSDLLKGHFQLVERVVTSLIDTRRLAGRADEKARE